MPKPPLPDEADRLLRKANPAVIATLRQDGSPHTAVTWYDWDGERLLVNMDAARARLKNMRRDSRVSLTVMDSESWYRQLTIFGRVAEIRADPEFKDIDRLCLRYTRRQFHNRLRARISALIEPVGWYGWEGSTPWPLTRD
jgi:PPOX class probable F420-dependent enzyme